MVTHVRLREQLEIRLTAILNRVQRIEQDIRKAPERDWTEQAAAAENDQVLEALDEITRAEVLDIRRALNRIAQGQYGFCTACHEPIDEHRLATTPTAERCIYCAE